jgi:hypothetical protein
LTGTATATKFIAAELIRFDEKGRQEEGGLTMSQPFSRFLHPFDVAHHPSFEPEVKRAILSFWASESPAAKKDPVRRRPFGRDRAGRRTAATCAVDHEPVAKAPS